MSDKNNPPDNKATTTPKSSETKTAKPAPNTQTNPANKTNKSASKSTASTTPPKTPENPQKPSAPAAKKGGSGLAALALLVGLSGAGIGGFSYVQQSNLNDKTTELQSLVDSARINASQNEKRVLQAEETINALQTHIAGASQGLDKAQVSQLVASALGDYAKSQPEAINAEQVQEYVGQQIARIQMPESGASRQEVETLIQQAIVNLNSDKPVDLSDTIAALNESQKATEMALNTLNQRSGQIQQGLDQQAQRLGSELEQRVQTQANPQPLINALTLAFIAMDNGDFSTADAYLIEAENSFIPFGLDASAFADYKTRIGQMRQEISTRANDSSTITRINSIIDGINDWPLRSIVAESAAEEAPIQGENWQQTAQNVGKKVISSTFTIVHNDETGVAWVENHPDLQVLIRENVHLDLAFARNALQLHNAEAYARTIDRLIPEIEKRFETDNEVVAGALATLNDLRSQQESTTPDIAALINAIKQTASN